MSLEADRLPVYGKNQALRGKPPRPPQPWLLKGGFDPGGAVAVEVAEVEGVEIEAVEVDAAGIDVDGAAKRSGAAPPKVIRTSLPFRKLPCIRNRSANG